MIVNYLKTSFRTIPGFFVLGLVLCLFVELGSAKLGKSANNALVGFVDINAVILFFICELVVIGSVLAVAGSLSANSGNLKRRTISYLVDRPVTFLATLILPAISVLSSVSICCIAFGYWSQLPTLFLGMLYYALFACMSLGLVLPTRRNFLAKLGSEFSGGRIAGILLLFSAGVFYYFALPVKGS